MKIDGIEESLLLDNLPDRDLTTLFPSGSTPASFGRGVVQSWNVATRRGDVLIDGQTFTDLSALDTSALLSILVNDVVLVLKLQRSWLIFGRILDPI